MSRRRFGPERVGSAAWKELRLAILARDDWTCQVCGGPASQVDHVIPRVQDGPTVEENLQSLCGTCNQVKSLSDAGAAALAKRRAMNGAEQVPDSEESPAWVCRLDPPCSSTAPHSRHW